MPIPYYSAGDCACVRAGGRVSLWSRSCSRSASWAGHCATGARGKRSRWRNFDFIALATIAGASTFRIMVKHLLPAVANTVGSGDNAAGVGKHHPFRKHSFLPGRGSSAADTVVGRGHIQWTREYLGSAWWVAFFPGMAIFLTVLSFNFIGDWAARPLGTRACARYSRHRRVIAVAMRLLEELYSIRYPLMWVLFIGGAIFLVLVGSGRGACLGIERQIGGVEGDAGCCRYRERADAFRGRRLSSECGSFCGRGCSNGPAYLEGDPQFTACLYELACYRRSSRAGVRRSGR